MAATALTTVTETAHEFLTDDLGQAYGLYLMADEEIAEASKAAAGLLSRRVPAGVGSPDANDLLSLGVVLAGYVVRQFRTHRMLRRVRQGLIETTDKTITEDGAPV